MPWVMLLLCESLSWVLLFPSSYLMVSSSIWRACRPSLYFFKTFLSTSSSFFNLWSFVSCIFSMHWFCSPNTDMFMLLGMCWSNDPWDPWWYPARSSSGRHRWGRWLLRLWWIDTWGYQLLFRIAAICGMSSALIVSCEIITDRTAVLSSSGRHKWGGWQQIVVRGGCLPPTAGWADWR